MGEGLLDTWETVELLEALRPLYSRIVGDHYHGIKKRKVGQTLPYNPELIAKLNAVTYDMLTFGVKDVMEYGQDYDLYLASLFKAAGWTQDEVKTWLPVLARNGFIVSEMGGQNRRWTESRNLPGMFDKKSAADKKEWFTEEADRWAGQLSTSYTSTVDEDVNNMLRKHWNDEAAYSKDGTQTPVSASLNPTNEYPHDVPFNDSRGFMNINWEPDPDWKTDINPTDLEEAEQLILTPGFNMEVYNRQTLGVQKAIRAISNLAEPILHPNSGALLGFHPELKGYGAAVMEPLLALRKEMGGAYWLKEGDHHPAIDSNWVKRNEEYKKAVEEGYARGKDDGPFEIAGITEREVPSHAAYDPEFPLEYRNKFYSEYLDFGYLQPDAFLQLSDAQLKKLAEWSVLPPSAGTKASHDAWQMDIEKWRATGSYHDWQFLSPATKAILELSRRGVGDALPPGVQNFVNYQTTNFLDRLSPKGKTLAGDTRNRGPLPDETPSQSGVFNISSVAEMEETLPAVLGGKVPIPSTNAEKHIAFEKLWEMFSGKQYYQGELVATDTTGRVYKWGEFFKPHRVQELLQEFLPGTGFYEKAAFLKEAGFTDEAVENYLLYHTDVAAWDEAGGRRLHKIYEDADSNDLGSPTNNDVYSGFEPVPPKDWGITPEAALGDTDLIGRPWSEHKPLEESGGTRSAVDEMAAKLADSDSEVGDWEDFLADGMEETPSPQRAVQQAASSRPPRPKLVKGSSDGEILDYIASYKGYDYVVQKGVDPEGELYGSYYAEDPFTGNTEEFRTLKEANEFKNEVFRRIHRRRRSLRSQGDVLAGRPSPAAGGKFTPPAPEAGQ